jgi:hypothetical protein
MESLLEPKMFVSMCAIALTFIGYIPYIGDIYRKKTRPHLFSWVIWTVVTTLIGSLQWSAGAGPGALITFSLSIILAYVSVLAWTYGTNDIERNDVICALLALAAIPIWLLMEQPVPSIILLCSIDAVAFLPTVRKSWREPYSETLSFYIITAVRHALSFAALAEYNIVTILFPLTWIVANAAFAVMLTHRRRHIRRKKHT